MEDVSSGAESALTERPARYEAIIASVSLLAFVALFTILKFPDVRVRTLIQSTMAQALSPTGASVTSDGSSFSVLRGFRYEMTQAQVRAPGVREPFKIDRLWASPSFVSLVTARTGIDVDLRQGDGSLSGTLLTRGSSVWVDLNLDKLDLGKLGVFAILLKLQASAMAAGTVDVKFNSQDLPDSSGKIQLSVDGLSLPTQMLFGFSFPSILVPKTKLDAEIKDGKLHIENLELAGDPKNPSDLTAKISGDIILAQKLESSRLALTAKFSLGEKLKTSFAILDAILGAGKQPDGSYVVKIGGTLSQPNPVAGG